jgi:hypothetical protein
MLFTTVVQSLIEATSRKRDVHRFRVAFFGTFLAKQKSANSLLNQNLHYALLFDNLIAQQVNYLFLIFYLLLNKKGILLGMPYKNL